MEGILLPPSVLPILPHKCDIVEAKIVQVHTRSILMPLHTLVSEIVSVEMAIIRLMCYRVITDNLIFSETNSLYLLHSHILQGPCGPCNGELHCLHRDEQPLVSSFFIKNELCKTHRRLLSGASSLLKPYRT